MAEKKKRYRYLDELERSERADEREQRAGRREEEERLRRARQQREAARARKKKERRKQVMITWLIILISLAAVAFAIAAVIRYRTAGKVTDGQGSDSVVASVPESTETPASTAADTPASEAAASGTSAATDTDTSAVQEPTPTPTPEVTFADWNYTTDAAMPEGDIVQYDSQIYNYDQMREDLHFLEQRYSDKLTVCKIGTTADNRDILDAVIGSESAGKDVIVQYSMHAREYINTPLAMTQLESILKGWDSSTYDGQLYSQLFANVRFHIIPMINPDGVAISQYGFEAIRDEDMRAKLYEIWNYDIEMHEGSTDYEEYYTRWKANGRGVDLNRNYDQGWETTGGRLSYSCERYPGEYANSELETQAIIRVKDAVNCVAEIAYHSMGQVVYWDYGTTGDLYEKDNRLAATVSALTGYEQTSSVDSAQNSAGCSDYFILACGIPAITIETGSETAPVPYEQWPQIWAENQYILPAVAELAATF